MRNRHALPWAVLALAVIACGGEAPPNPEAGAVPSGNRTAVIDSAVRDNFIAAGTAHPVRQAALSTRLMASVTEVLVREGDRVEAGQALVRLDARDLDARREQAEAALTGATALQAEASTYAGRIQALYRDSAATRAQLDQAESALARADAAVTGARAMLAELAATASYTEVSAPFSSIVTRRLVDPGAFASPGAPLVTVEDASTLRITVSATPDAVDGLRRGDLLTGYVGDSAVRATVEGVVPDGSNSYSVNALVANAGGRLLPGSSARLAIPRGTRTALLVPKGAIVRQGNLTGVQVVVGGRAALRWVRLGETFDGWMELLSGVAPGDTVLVSATER